MATEFGRGIISNASIKFLIKQSTSSIHTLAEHFYLSEGEKQLLVSSDVGEGIFFAGQNHVALRVVASQDEYEVITTDPEELLHKQKTAAIPQAPSPASLTQAARSPSATPITAPSFGKPATLAPTPAGQAAPAVSTAPQPTQPSFSQTLKPPTPPAPQQFAGSYTIDDYQPPK